MVAVGRAVRDRVALVAPAYAWLLFVGQDVVETNHWYWMPVVLPVGAFPLITGRLLTQDLAMVLSVSVAHGFAGAQSVARTVTQLLS